MSPFQTASRRLALGAACALVLIAAGPGCDMKKKKKVITLDDPPKTAKSAQPAHSSASAAAPGSGSAAPSSAATPAAAHAAAPAPTRTADGALLLSGTTYAYRRATLAPKVGGTVAKLNVRAGQKVKANEALLVLEQTDFALQLRQARAAQTTARARLDAVRVEWKRLRSLVKDKAVPRSQFDKVDAQFKVARAAQAQADIAVAMARRALSNTVVRAPFAGIVTHVFIERGEATVRMPPTRLCTIAEIDKLELRVEVPESGINQVHEGTRLHARFSAVNKTLDLKVARVVRSLDARTRSFLAIANIDNRAGTLRPGMFARVRLARGAEAKR